MSQKFKFFHGVVAPRVMDDAISESMSDLTGLSCPEESLADQSFKDECDINVMLERMRIGSFMPDRLDVPGEVVYTEVFDFQTAQNAVRAGVEAFAKVPAKIRARFENDPAQFLEFLSSPDNLDEAVRLGLATKREDVIVSPTKVEIVQGAPLPSPPKE